MTVPRMLRAFWTCVLPVALWTLAGCVPAKTTVYATPDYHSWKRTTDVVLDYPIPGHQDRFRIPTAHHHGEGSQ